MRFIPNSVTRSLARKVLTTKKNSPHIFFGLGVVGVVGSTILACRATLKLEKTVDEIRGDFQDVKTLRNNKQYTTDQEYYKDLGYIYMKNGVKLGKLYGPAVVLGGVSIAALTGSHVQLSRRNTALTFTLTAVSKAFDEYRIRVREEVGEERELEIHRSITDEKMDIEGKKQLVKVTDPNGWSPYARFFDYTNPNWQKTDELNRIFLEVQQNYMNQRLAANGHIFLNEVYDHLGLERSTPGAVVGWLYKDGQGDGYIDFGITEAFNCLDDQFSIILDFNVDGVIFEQI